ncbi:MAG: outer membrane protein assembly factor BamA [Succinivibrionaceae bacterium]|nr:outer membrane protein assembly factor BamA [Succinivibrionaceae bacterium]
MNAMAAEIRDIKVDGLQRVSLGAVLLNIPVGVGDNADDAAVAETIKKLYATGNFDDISVNVRQGGVLAISVKERPTISNIEYAGNDDIKEDKIEPIINDMGIRLGEPLNRAKLVEVERGLTEYYHTNGKYQAYVRVLVTDLPRNRVKLRIQFAEGKSSRIKQLNIIGNKAFSEKKLLSKLDLDDDSPWWDFFSSDKYSKTKLEGDLEKLRSFYLNRGYIRFDIKNTDVSITPDKKGVYVTLNINEGEQYTVKEVTVSGDLVKHDDDIRKLVTIEPGDIYSKQVTTNNEQMIASFVGKFGYSDAQVTTYPKIDDEKKEVTLHMFVSPGPRVSVNEIRISGNKVTKDVVVRRELRQFEGAWLSNEKVEQSKRRLGRLGFFEKVDIDTVKIPGSEDVVDLDVKVKERQVNSISGSISYGTVSGISFGAKLAQDNMLGYGYRGEIEWNWSKAHRKYGLSLRDPYFTLDGISLMGKIYYDDYRAGEDDLINYENRTVGFELKAGYPVNELNFLEYGLNVERSKISQAQSYAQVQKFWRIYDKYTDSENRLNINTFAFTFDWTRNNLDKGIFPTDGDKEEFWFKVAIPGSDVQYYKATLEATKFWPLTREHDYSFNVRGIAGYGNGYGKIDGHDHVLPFFQNFYEGGGPWLRGFRNNSVGPKAIYSYPYQGRMTEVGTSSAIGGNAMWALTAELVVPTPFVDEGYEDQLRTSVFFDMGNVFDTTYDKDRYNHCMSHCNKIYDMKDPWRYRSSVGVTLQWISPVGPLAVTLARPIKERKGDDTEVFSFSIGKTF